MGHPTAEEELKIMTLRFWAQVAVSEKLERERDEASAWVSRIFRDLGLPEGDMGSLENYISAKSSTGLFGFAGELDIIARLLDERGFRLGRGTYHHGNGEILPTLVINRGDTPEWCGVWTPWETVPELSGEVAGEIQAAFALAGTAIQEWNLQAWRYDKLTCSAPSGGAIDPSL